MIEPAASALALMRTLVSRYVRTIPVVPGGITGIPLKLTEPPPAAICPGKRLKPVPLTPYDVAATVWPQLLAAPPGAFSADTVHWFVALAGVSSMIRDASEKTTGVPPSNRLVIGALMNTVRLPCNDGVEAVVVPTVGVAPPGKNPPQLITTSPISSVNKKLPFDLGRHAFTRLPGSSVASARPEVFGRSWPGSLR